MILILTLQSGQGTAIYNNGNNYTGAFSRGLKHGRGVFRASTGDVFTGEFRAGMREGEGIETFYNGEKYVGQYRGDISSILTGAYNENFPCMEANYPNAIKNQRGASKKTPSSKALVRKGRL